MAQTKKAAELTQEQKELFLKGLKDKGLSVDNIAGSIETNGEHCYLTDKPGQKSLIPVRKFSVHHLDELKAVAGNHDEEYEKGNMEAHLHEDLPPWDAAKNAHKPEELSAEENNNIVKAMKTYVFGHSAKVKSYMDVIHSHHFPMTLASYAAEDLTVKSGETLHVTGSMATGDFGTVTVEAGGTIAFETTSTWNVVSFVSL